MSKEWRGINNFYFVRPGKQKDTDPESVDIDSIDEKPASQEKDEPEVRLSDGAFHEGADGFVFNKKCKIRTKVENLKETQRTKVTFNTFVVTDGEEEDLGQQVEGFVKDGYAEAEMMLYYGDKFSEKLRSDPTTKCEYIFKASHSNGKNIVTSKPLKMPYVLDIDGNVQILEMEDVLFNSDSAVLLPEGPKEDGRKDDTREKEQKQVGGLAMLKAVCEFAKENSEKKLLVLGHTDTLDDNKHNLELSRARARSVYYLLRGDRENWVSTVEKRNEENLQKKEYRNQDIRQVLTWINGKFGISCDPKKTDGSAIDSDPDTRKAIKGFREGYQKKSNNDKFKAQEYDAPASGSEYWGWAYKGEKPGWGAVFDVYMHYLATKLLGLKNYAEYKTQYADSIMKDALDWQDVHPDKQDPKDGAYAAIGCGEERPIDGFDEEWKPKDEFKSQKNRRVEAMFFDAEEAKQIVKNPALGPNKYLPCHEGDMPCAHCKPKGKPEDPCPIYGKNEEGKWWFRPEYLWADDVEDGGLLGSVKVHLVTPHYNPLTGISCTLVTKEGQEYQTILSDSRGEVTWESLFLDEYFVHMKLDDRNITFLVPWLHEDSEKHSVLILDAEELLGSNDESHSIQARLLGLGYDCGTIDGIIGQKSKKAVKDFQKDHYLKDTGDPNEATKVLLKNLFGA